MPDPTIKVIFKENGIEFEFTDSCKVSNRMFERMIMMARRALRSDRMKAVQEMRKQEAAEVKKQVEDAAQRKDEATIEKAALPIKERIQALGIK